MPAFVGSTSSLVALLTSCVTLPVFSLCGCSPSGYFLGVNAPAIPLDLSAAVRDYMVRHAQLLLQHLATDDPLAGGIEFGENRAAIMDGLLRPLFAAACEQLGIDPTAPGSEVALGAVGSYGRGAVALHSDLDVRLLTTSSEGRWGELAEKMLYPLWDAGVDVGHQVITPSETVKLGKTDLPTATGILDFRFLAGDERLAKELDSQARARLFSESGCQEFVARLTEELQGRHNRFGGSVYLLEPDVKSGAGGLRDLDVAGWVAKARWASDDPQSLVRLGILLRREAQSLVDARQMLWRVRNRIHQVSRRRSDRLSFDMQESLSTSLGYGEGGAAIETLMSDYYRHARTLTQMRELIFHRAAPMGHHRKARRKDLGDGVWSYGQYATFGNRECMQAEPSLALRIFRKALDRDLEVYPAARDTIARMTQDGVFSSKLRACPDAGEDFIGLVATAKPAVFSRGSVLRALHDVGLLIAMIPEFSPVVGRVHNDIYHVYTVDIHSIAAVDKLRALIRGDYAGQFPLATRLAGDVHRPRILYMATLLHDVGKAIGGRDHANRGAEMVKTIGPRLGMDEEEVEQVERLVRTHLLMYHTATKRDLDDPQTIETFCENVSGMEGLKELYLLTVSDISTTSPTALTAWKARMLDDLYLAAARHLTGEGEKPDQQAMRKRSRVWELAQQKGNVEAFLRQMPDRYILATTPKAILAHSAIAQTAEEKGAAVGVFPTKDQEIFELCVVMQDSWGALAAITAAIAKGRMTVLSAQLHARELEDGQPAQAVDIFRVQGLGVGKGREKQTAASILAALERFAAEGPPEVEGVSQKPSIGERPSPEIAADVIVDHWASPTHTVIEVVSRDRRGLLYMLAKTFCDMGISISLAKINTEGQRIVDIFYVTERDGKRLAIGSRSDEVQATLRRELATFEGH